MSVTISKKIWPLIIAFLCANGFAKEFETDKWSFTEKFLESEYKVVLNFKKNLVEFDFGGGKYKETKMINLGAEKYSADLGFGEMNFLIREIKGKKSICSEKKSNDCQILRKEK